MGGDRRSPPRHRNKGGGGAKSKGTSSGQGNCSGGGSKGGTKGFSKSGALKIGSGSPIDSDFKKSDGYVADAKDSLIGMMNLDQCAQDIDELNGDLTPDGRSMETDEFLDEEIGVKNFKILADNIPISPVGADFDVLGSGIKNDGFIPNVCPTISERQESTMVISSNFMHLDGNIGSRIEMEDGQIPGMSLNHNPMFGIDDISVQMDNGMESWLKEGEELIVNNVMEKNLMSSINCISKDANISVRRDCREGICLNADKSDPSINIEMIHASRTEVRRRPEVLSGTQNNVHNAWKKPNHVPVDWQNKGKATEDGKFVKLNLDAISHNQSKLEKSLVGKLIGKKLPFNILAAELRKRWEPFGDFRFMLMGEDSFTCSFNSLEARDAVLMGGPWLIGGHIVGMDKWSPSCSPNSLSGLSSPVWIRLPNLPLLYWDNDNLARIASMVGQPLWIDAQTSALGKCAYARVCVQLDLAQKLTKGVWIPGINGNFFQKVKYEGIYSACLKCGLIGHNAENCGVENVRRGTEGRTGAIPRMVQNAKPIFGWKGGVLK